MASCLPTPEVLARLVEQVVGTLLGLTFTHAAGSTAHHAPERTALLPIPGAQPVTVALSACAGGRVQLGAAMFGCAPEAVDEGMKDDALMELANITAGQVRLAMRLDQALGLPRMLAAGELPDTVGRNVLLRAGASELSVRVFDSPL